MHMLFQVLSIRFLVSSVHHWRPSVEVGLSISCSNFWVHSVQLWWVFQVWYYLHSFALSNPWLLQKCAHYVCFIFLIVTVSFSTGGGRYLCIITYSTAVMYWIKFCNAIICTWFISRLEHYVSLSPGVNNMWNYYTELILVNLVPRPAPLRFTPFRNSPWDIPRGE